MQPFFKRIVLYILQKWYVSAWVTEYCLTILRKILQTKKVRDLLRKTLFGLTLHENSQWCRSVASMNGLSLLLIYLKIICVVIRVIEEIQSFEMSHSETLLVLL